MVPYSDAEQRTVQMSTKNIEGKSFWKYLRLQSHCEQGKILCLDEWSNKGLWMGIPPSL